MGRSGNHRQPNILLVMADQMTAMALALYGAGQAKTPALEALAARGLRFQNAYCNFPCLLYTSPSPRDA